MKTKEQTKKWLLKNVVDEYGDLDLSELDFSDFDGNIFINEMKVKCNLYQDSQVVQGNLYQKCQKVKRNLYQDRQQVECTLFQNSQKVKGDLIQNYQKVDRNLYQNCQSVKGDLVQNCQKVLLKFITQKLQKNEKYKIDEYGNNCIVKKVKKGEENEII